jgi:predicted DNA-binding protein
LVRTQIYLTEDERQALKSMAVSTGRKQSELIREAIDQMIEKYQIDSQTRLRQQAKGMWKDRTDLPDLAVRREWDRI